MVDQAATDIPKDLALFTGSTMPAVGFGCWKVPKEKTAECVYTAIKQGYRLLDEACDYGNEKECGEGIKKAIDDGLIKREELFVTSKLWNTFHKKEHVKPAFQRTLSDLGLEYLDLYQSKPELKRLMDKFSQDVGADEQAISEPKFIELYKEGMTFQRAHHLAIRLFNKHDRDQSGDISVEEFRGLATDLGTVPELTDEEVAEAVAQIDKSNDAEFSFEELWTWWIQDKL